jgi:predicted nucleic acid-binding protein
MGFLRLVTQAAVMNQCGAAPLTNTEAREFLTNVFHDAAVSRADEPAGMRALWLQLAERPTPSPNVWLDAYLASFAITLGSELVTFDRGFEVYQQSGLALHLLESP